MTLPLSLALACGGDSDAWSVPGNGIPAIDESGAVTTDSGLVVVITREGAEGLSMLKKGSQGWLRIPSDLACGAKGKPPVIPPDAELVFDLWLLE